jgi:hypothetical protein
VTGRRSRRGRLRSFDGPTQKAGKLLGRQSGCEKREVVSARLLAGGIA